MSFSFEVATGSEIGIVNFVTPVTDFLSKPPTTTFKNFQFRLWREEEIRCKLTTLFLTSLTSDIFKKLLELHSSGTHFCSFPLSNFRSHIFLFLSSSLQTSFLAKKLFMIRTDSTDKCCFIASLKSRRKTSQFSAFSLTFIYQKR